MTAFCAQGFDPITCRPAPKLLAEILLYDPVSGVLTWRPRARELFPTRRHWLTWNTRFAGCEAGRIGLGGYRELGLWGITTRAHRIAFAIHHGYWPNLVVDHIDGNPANNRITNLRCVSQAENCRNSSLNRLNKSGTPGVSWVRRDQRWQVHIKDADGKSVFLGRYLELDEAVAVRRRAEAEHGYHPNHGRAQAVNAALNAEVTP